MPLFLSNENNFFFFLADLPLLVITTVNQHFKTKQVEVYSLPSAGNSEGSGKEGSRLGRNFPPFLPI